MVALFKMEPTPTDPPLGANHSTTHPVRKIKGEGCGKKKKNTGGFTLRFVLPRSWVGYPSRRPKGCGMQSPSGPKVYPKATHRMPRYSVRAPFSLQTPVE